MRILVTGGCGFVGHHFIDHLIKNTDWEVVILDRLSYASSGFDRLRDSKLFDESRVLILSADFTQPIIDGLANEIGAVDYIVHMGAETHVDRSITDPRPFVLSNVVGTMEVLEFARKVKGLKKFIYFSTDEVFGPSENEYAFKEWDRYKSSTPYSASKAGGEELTIAYHNTYGVPTVVIHTMNIFGERQHPEKFIPLMVRKLLQKEVIELHADFTRNTFSTRCWIHARTVAAAVFFLLTTGETGEKYNVVGERRSNLDLVILAAETIRGMGIELDWRSMSVDAKTARAGHDLHYILDGEKMAAMGWKAPVDFTNSYHKTVKWFVNNKRWLGL
jgi:dTDP-glucose 4,6-dehydratase